MFFFLHFEEGKYQTHGTTSKQAVHMNVITKEISTIMMN